MDKVGLVYYLITSTGYATFWALLLYTLAGSNKKLKKVLVSIGFIIGVCFGMSLLSTLPINVSIIKVKQLIVASSIIAGVSGILIHRGLTQKNIYKFHINYYTIYNFLFWIYNWSIICRTLFY